MASLLSTHGGAAKTANSSIKTRDIQFVYTVVNEDMVAHGVSVPCQKATQCMCIGSTSC